LESEGSTQTLDSFVNSLEPELHSSVAVDDTGAVAALVRSQVQLEAISLVSDPSVFNQT